MSHVISLHCPECGNQLQFESDEQVIYCTYCGKKLLFQNDGLVSAGEEPPSTLPSKIDITTSLLSKQTSAVAIQTIESEIRKANADIKAAGKLGVIYWLGMILLVGSFIFVVPLVSDVNNSLFANWMNLMCIWGVCLLLGLAGLIYGSVRQRKNQKKREKEWALYLEYLEKELAKHRENIIS